MTSAFWTSQFEIPKWRLQGYLLSLPRKWMKGAHYLIPSDWVSSFKIIKDNGCHRASPSHLILQSNCWNTVPDIIHQPFPSVHYLMLVCETYHCFMPLNYCLWSLGLLFAIFILCHLLSQQWLSNISSLDIYVLLYLLLLKCKLVRAETVFIV